MDWERFTLLMFVLMRMSGFVLFSPIFGRQGVPALVRTGLVLVFSITVISITPGGTAVPGTLVEFAVKLCLELALGYAVGFVSHLFFYIPLMAGDIVDTQMGMTMSKTYDPGSQANMSVTGTIINVMMFLLFFSANGHNTLIRIMLTSGDLIPFGAAALGTDVANAVAELFILCTTMGVKLALPILAAELIGQVGMGILMKAIPQINVFAINIELKVIIGLGLVILFMTPFSEFLLEAENLMLVEMRRMLTLAG